MIGRLLGYTRSLLRNRRQRDDLPRFLTYTVTFACNAKCIMCDSWKMSEKGDLSLEEIGRIFDQLPNLDGVRLTGGEPFVRKDMIEIAELATAKLKPLMIHVTTNGFLTDRIVEFCEQRPRGTKLDLLVSMDGVGEKHNHIRGNTTAYDSCIKTIEALAPRKKELNLNLSVNQTIVDADGIDHYRRLREVLRPYDVRNNVVMAYDVSATYNLEREIDVAPTQIGEFTTFGEFTEDHIRELVAEIEADLPSFPLLQRLAKKYYLRGIKNRLLGGPAEPNPKCVALNAHLRIFPNGDVPTCQFNSKTAGNLREQSFEEVWTGAKGREQREWVRKCPGCWAECEVLPSAIYTGDLLLKTFLPGRDEIPESGDGSRVVTTSKPPEVVELSTGDELLPVLSNDGESSGS